MSAPILGKMQIGKETAHGTAVAATKMLFATQGPIPSDRKVTALSPDIGKNVETTGRMLQGVLAQDSLTFDQLYFGILPTLLSGLLKGGVTPVEQTVGEGDYLWDHTPGLGDTDDNTPNSFTLERGDNIQAVQIAHVMFKSLKLDWQVNQDGGESSVKASVDYFGKANVNHAFTAGLSVPTFIPLNGKLCQVYFDTLMADVGDTEISDFLRSGSLEISGGLVPDFNGGASEEFTSFHQGPISAMLTLTVKRGAASEAMRAAINETRACRLKFNGPQIGDGVNNMLQFDLFGYVDDVVPLAQTDRNKSANLDTMVLHSIYDPISGKVIVPQIITDIATL